MTQGREPTLEELLAESQAQFASAVTELNRLGEEAQQNALASQAALDRSDAELAEKARNGELGEERRRMQERIDLNETSWARVLSGQDDSPEVATLFGYLEANLDEAALQVDETIVADREAGQPDPRAELIEAFAELRASIAAVISEENQRGQ